MMECEALCRFSKYGGGGIRTHGALADTLVFKSSGLLVIAVNLIFFKEQSSPKVHHL